MRLTEASYLMDDTDNLFSGVSKLLRKCGFDDDFKLYALPGGQNNRVFRIIVTNHRVLLKSYFRHPDDLRDRLGAEFKFLSFAWDHGLRCLPKPLGFDEEHALGIYEYLEGVPLSPGQIGEDEIKQAAEFIRLLNEHKDSVKARGLANASEACFSLDEHKNTVDARVKRLENIDCATLTSQYLSDFIRSELRPAWDKIKWEFEKEAERLGIPMNEIVGVEERCISPSDFGFHNAIRVSDGRLRFFDFEYAGWDDPAKLVCDFFCQPKIPAPSELRKSFVKRATINFAGRETFLKRAGLLTPLYRVKWCCIILNECLPEGRARRQFAGASPLSSHTNGARKVEQARSLLQRAFLP